MANASVKTRKNEDITRTIKRFKRKVEASGIMREIKKRRYYRKPSEAKKIKRAAAAKRRRKNARRKKR
tara:strand:- start:701 stop:904 length:204 start_codon:yes stop_codon:yes gene_type:complete